MESVKKIFFYLVAIVHILIWSFIVFAFSSVKYAKMNIYYVIPLIYMIHILPFHLLVKTKKSLYPNTWEEKQDDFATVLIFPKLYNDLCDSLSKVSTFNPISPQGLMIFGMISSLFKIYPPPYFVE